ncbi:uncharacterized protein LOC124448499 isoform X1 [Xenia sp. Carnegie-2017]|uniref:uncharacterized protein LOC124448499 isoform X1 n=1 Tax=Xenia sp. Carnegie-2017 TaxID=2897299 RepID=UPI001F03574F|nr:uncharacterized protein LOC124448499 isoform X1 [Xenia sp. Carnegie-2017]
MSSICSLHFKPEDFTRRYTSLQGKISRLVFVEVGVFAFPSVHLLERLMKESVPSERNVDRLLEIFCLAQKQVLALLVKTLLELKVLPLWKTVILMLNLLMMSCKFKQLQYKQKYRFRMGFAKLKKNIASNVFNTKKT